MKTNQIIKAGITAAAGGLIITEIEKGAIELAQKTESKIGISSLLVFGVIAITGARFVVMKEIESVFKTED